MLGEIRLGFFVEGIGYYKECSKLIHKIDSSSKLKHIVEGSILEVDEDLYKVQSVELGFIPSPGRSGFHREKPIKVIYVSKAHTELMGAKTKASAIDTKKLAPAETRGDIKESTIKDDKNYGEPEFTEEFPHLIEKPKRTKRKKRALTEGSVRGEIKSGSRKKPECPPPAPIPKKEAKPKRSRTVKPAPKAGTVKPKVVAKAIKAVKKEDKPEKKTRRKRCKGCGGLFKSIGRHKCKTK